MRSVLCLTGTLFLAVLLIHPGVFAADDPVVAKIGERKIKLSEFKKIIDYFDTERQKMLEMNPQLKETVLRQFVQSIVISDLAKKKQFDKNAEIQEHLQFFVDNFLANEYLKREIAEKVTVADFELKAYYDANADEFRTPEMVKARHILVKAGTADDERKKAREDAELYMKKLKEGEDFAGLAAEVSDDPGSKTRGGDLGYFPRGRMVKPFEDAAFSLKPGEMSEITESQFGFHIIKVEDRKDSKVEAFDSVRERLKQKLLHDHTRTNVAEFIEKAMQDAKTELYLDALTGGNK